MNYKKPLSNHDLENLANHFSLPIQIYMKDETKSVIPNVAYIINLGELDSNGTHWVGFIQKNDKIYYFDSYGFMPADQIEKVFKKTKNEVFYNIKQIQHFDSIMCGWFVLGFLIHMYFNKNQSDLNSFNNYLNLFNTRKNHLQNNDSKIIEIIENYVAQSST